MVGGMRHVKRRQRGEGVNILLSGRQWAIWQRTTRKKRYRRGYESVKTGKKEKVSCRLLQGAGGFSAEENQSEKKGGGGSVAWEGGGRGRCGEAFARSEGYWRFGKKTRSREC